MSHPEAEQTQASIIVDAPAEITYAMLVDVANWPLLYPWIAHTEFVERAPAEDLVQFWAVNPLGRIRIWTSRRYLDASALRMDIEQQGSVGPITGLTGSWTFKPLPGDRCLVESRHAFHAATPEDRAAGVTELNRHGKLQMETLKSRVENRARLAELTWSFEDSLVVESELGQVYRALRDVGSWPAHLPYLTALEVTEDENDVQFYDVRTHDANESSRYVRICLPDKGIAYKQLTVTAPVDLHLGRWTLAETPAGVSVTSAHTVLVNPSAAEQLPELRDRLHKTLSADSLAELQLVKRLAETR